MITQLSQTKDQTEYLEHSLHTMMHFLCLLLLMALGQALGWFILMSTRDTQASQVGGITATLAAHARYLVAESEITQYKYQ
jgi:hypothetical protein